MAATIERVRLVRGEPGTILVPSRSHPGRWHTVTCRSYEDGGAVAECECEGAEFHAACWHKARALAVFKAMEIIANTVEPEGNVDMTAEEPTPVVVGTIDAALAAIYREVGYVQKRRPPRDSGINYTYAGEADIIEALRPSMAEYGVTARVHSLRDVVHDAVVVGRNNSVMQRCTLIATVRFTHGPSGTWVDCEAIGEGMDSGDKASNKAMTGALKYALRQTFVLETGNDPDDSRPEFEAERTYRGGVAQRTEQATPKGPVAGSSPAPATTTDAVDPETGVVYDAMGPSYADEVAVLLAKHGLKPGDLAPILRAAIGTGQARPENLERYHEETGKSAADLVGYARDIKRQQAGGV